MARAGVRLLSTGALEPEPFLADVNRRLNLDLAPQAFCDLWGLDLPGPVDGMIELLSEVKRRAPVALLSDTNAFHWEFLARHYPVLDEITPAFLSFREGLSKPDSRFYQRVQARLLNPPEPKDQPPSEQGGGGRGEKPILPSPPANGPGSILYFDDLLPNIKAALSLQWDAHLFVDRAKTEEVLRERGVL